MYQCSVELSVRYDAQSRNESEHASLIAEHAPLILWQTSDYILNTGFVPVVRLHDKHTRSVLFGIAAD